MSTHQAQPDTPAAPPHSPTSATASTSTDPRSARIEIWVEEVRRVAEPPPPSPSPAHDQDQDQQHPPGWPTPRKERGVRILGGLRKLGRRLAGGSRERELEREREREGEAPGEGTAMYSGTGAAGAAAHGAPGGDDDFDGGSSEGDVARGMRERGERLDRARRLLERSGKKRQDTGGGPPA